MIESLNRGKIPDAILVVLGESSPLCNLDLATRVVAITGCTPSGVRKMIWTLTEEGILYCDKVNQKQHMYSVAGEDPVRYSVPPSKFKIPLKLRGEVLSPMAWCARQLGAPA